MYKFLRILRCFPYRKGAHQFDRFDFQKRGISEIEFTYYLQGETNYLKDWRQTIKEIPMWFGRMPKISSSGLIRVQKRNHAIELVIEGCREKGYLEPKNVNGNLKITSKGWRFSGFWKVAFLSECLIEYKLAQIILIGIIGGIPLGAIILSLLQKLGIL